MDRIFLLIIFLIKSYLICAQNLVPNPGFDYVIQCPYDLSQIEFCESWKSAGMPYWSTPDYFNDCSSNPNVSPPIVAWGEQTPHSSNAYSFILTFVTFPNPALGREYIISELIQPLIIGQTYYVSFYYSLGGRNGVSIGSNKLGAFFTTYSFDSINYAMPNNYAHVYSDSIITDTVAWTHFKSSFIADSAYSFITIGNFFDNSLTDTLALNANSPNASGYFIDDVCVSTDSNFCFNYNILYELPDNINLSVLPIPATNELNINTTNIINHISLYDLRGRNMFEIENIQSTHFTFDCTALTNGIFIMNINGIYKKIIVQH